MPMYSPTDEDAAKALPDLNEGPDPISEILTHVEKEAEPEVAPISAAVAPRAEPVRHAPISAQPEPAVSAPVVPLASPKPAPARQAVAEASGTVILRVSVPHAMSPFDDPDAAIKIVDEILGGGLAQTVHEREAMIAYPWEGKVQRRAHTVLEIRADKAHQAAIMAIMTRLHPSRNPDITVSEAEMLSLS